MRKFELFNKLLAVRVASLWLASLCLLICLQQAPTAFACDPTIQSCSEPEYVEENMSSVDDDPAGYVLDDDTDDYQTIPSPPPSHSVEDSQPVSTELSLSSAKEALSHAASSTYHNGFREALANGDFDQLKTLQIEAAKASSQTASELLDWTMPKPIAELAANLIYDPTTVVNNGYELIDTAAAVAQDEATVTDLGSAAYAYATEGSIPGRIFDSVVTSAERVDSAKRQVGDAAVENLGDAANPLTQLTTRVVAEGQAQFAFTAGSLITGELPPDVLTPESVDAYAAKVLKASQPLEITKSLAAGGTSAVITATAGTFVLLAEQPLEAITPESWSDSIETDIHQVLGTAHTYYWNAADNKIAYADGAVITLIVAPDAPTAAIGGLSRMSRMGRNLVGAADSTAVKTEGAVLSTAVSKVDTAATKPASLTDDAATASTSVLPNETAATPSVAPVKSERPPVNPELAKKLQPYHDYARKTPPNESPLYVVRCTVLAACSKLLNISGSENAPEGAAIIIANHTNALDPISVGASMPTVPANIMAKHTLFSNPAVGWFLSRLGAFPVVRGAADSEAMITAQMILTREGIVLMFPEGTRLAGGGLGEFKVGAAKLATENGVPVVPVGLSGGGGALPPTTVVVGPPVVLSETQTLTEATAELKAAVQALLE